MSLGRRLRSRHGHGAVLLAVLAAAGCAGPAPATPAPTPTVAAPSASATPPPSPPDLAARPLAWFAPLPPLAVVPGREFTGSDDFMELFEPGADWGTAGGRIDVLKLYGEWVGSSASREDLRAVVATARRLGLALAVEVGPLDPTPTCGEGVESFNGPAEGVRLARLIQAAGGRLDLVAMDEPWFYGHVYDGPRACRWELERIARGVVAFRDAVRTVFPDVIVGDTEALPREVDPGSLVAWLEAYRAVAGEPLPFVHLDLDFGRRDWPAMVADLRAVAAPLGTDVGLIVFGDPSDPDDRTWFGTAAARVLAASPDVAPPDHLLFQSWQDRPDRVLPAAGPDTWTWFIGQWATAPVSLQDLLPPPNLAAGGTARASATVAGSGASHAFDGDPGTDWNAGTGPPAWIEVDLGRSRSVGLVRLRVLQSPDGATDHRLLGRGSGTGDRWVELARFRGTTRDGQALEWRPDAPRKGIRLLRVATSGSPSWVAWREIEVYAAAP